jgi:chaperonin cofactor prefoldin
MANGDAQSTQEVERLEKSINTLEAQIPDIEKELLEVSQLGDAQKLEDLSKRLRTSKQALEETLALWERAQASLDSALNDATSE